MPQKTKRQAGDTTRPPGSLTHLLQAPVSAGECHGDRSCGTFPCEVSTAICLDLSNQRCFFQRPTKNPEMVTIFLLEQKVSPVSWI